jgi:hypothetical protein
MAEKEPKNVDTELEFRIFRERMAALIAIIIIVSGFVLVGLTLLFVDNAERFNRAKDLLLFVNPLLGVAIGYFFNKVTSDARAETAEKAADVASSTVQQAAQDRAAAIVEAEKLRGETDQMKTALEDLTNSAQEILTQPESAAGPGLGKLSLEGDTTRSSASTDDLRARMQLEASMKRAQKWLNKE